jgi:peptidoglycan hydrolase-like protein with peptidoglycan-binding domain
MGKSITASVGHHGVNLSNDVVTVQFLLNCVPIEEGGPTEELVIDGLVGPFTVGAINRFQQAHLPFVDGRVDPEKLGGKTIVELNRYDPTPDIPLTPQSVPNPPRFPPRGKGHGKKVSRHFPLPDFPSFPPGKGRGKKQSS